MMPWRACSHGSLLAACGLTLAAGPSYAHGPVHEQVAALTQRIAQDPRDAELYLRRGELLGHDGDTSAALADLDKAQRLDPALSAVALARGRVLFQARRFSEARDAFGSYLAARPHDAEALSSRARTHAQVGQPRAAVEDYTSAIRARQARGQAVPDDYVERARVLVGLGSEHVPEALRGLDEGLAQLGPLVSLGLFAIDLELAAGQLDAALARLATLAARAPRKEHWLARRAEILEKAGRILEARLAYEEAVAAIESLTQRHRRTRATLGLEARVREGLARLQDR